VLHVDQRQVRLPVGQDRIGLGQVLGRADDEEAVVEGQFDQPDEQRHIVQHQGSASFVGLVGHRASFALSNLGSQSTGAGQRPDFCANPVRSALEGRDSRPQVKRATCYGFRDARLRDSRRRNG